MAKACCVQGRRKTESYNTPNHKHKEMPTHPSKCGKQFSRGKGNQKGGGDSCFSQQTVRTGWIAKVRAQSFNPAFFVKGNKSFCTIMYNSHRQAHPVSTTWIKKGLLWLPFLHNEGPFPAVTLYFIIPLVYFVAQVVLCLFGRGLVCCLSLPFVWTPRVKLLTLPTQCHRIWHMMISQ